MPALVMPQVSPRNPVNYDIFAVGTDKVKPYFASVSMNGGTLQD